MDDYEVQMQEPDDEFTDSQDEYQDAAVDAANSEVEAATPVDTDAQQPSSLPTALLNLFTKILLGAGITAIITITLFVYFHTPQCLLGFIIAAYLVYMAFALKWDYEKGKIEEISVICSSIVNMPARNASRIVFRSVMESETETPVYYEFYVPGRPSTNTAFIPTYIYIIYFRPSDPRKLLAYFQV